MDPNSNNQQNNPINPVTPVNPTPQPQLQQSQEPILNEPQVSQPQIIPVSTVSTDQISKKGNGKGTILLILILILILIIGISFFIIFTKNQADKTPEVATTESNNQSTTPSAIPSPTSVEEATSLDDLDVSSPDADIQGLENATQGL